MHTHIHTHQNISLKWLYNWSIISKCLVFYRAIPWIGINFLSWKEVVSENSLSSLALWDGSVFNRQKSSHILYNNPDGTQPQRVSQMKTWKCMLLWKGDLKTLYFFKKWIGQLTYKSTVFGVLQGWGCQGVIQLCASKCPIQSPTCHCPPCTSLLYLMQDLCVTGQTSGEVHLVVSSAGWENITHWNTWTWQ